MSSKTAHWIIKGDIMKKTISLILSFAILVAVAYPCQSVIAAQANKNSAVYFSDSVNEIIDEYDADEEYIDDAGSSQVFIKDRLIVPSDNVKNDYGATESLCALGYTVLQYDTEDAAATAKENLVADGYNAQYDSILSCEDVNSTSSTSTRWGNDRIESQETLNAIKASGKELSDITVGVVDTGVDHTHPELADRVVETGLNFSSTGQANGSMDDQGHGTMVAGIIAQNTTDNVKIKPYKVLGSNGKCSTTQIIAVVNHILSEKDAPDVINLSLGGEINKADPFLDTQNELIQSLVAKGITVVVSAGNDSTDAGNYSPANISNVITVAASNSSNSRSSYSNFGTVIDIAAPGDNIFTYTMGGGYTSSYSGTSFASPFVAAAAATVLMLDDSLTPTQVETKIKDAAFPIVNNTSTVEWCGAGILNYSALFEEALAPSPTVSRESGSYSGAFSLEMTAPDGYKIMYTTDNTVPTLTNGTEYTQPIEITDAMNLVAVAINENNKSRYVPLSYSVIYPADESEFSITDSGAINGYTGDEKSIIVPDTINGITPTAVSSGAFNSTDIKAVVLPESVTKLNRNAFNQAASLTSITAPGVEDIGIFAFYYCTSLTDVDMPNVKVVRRSGFEGCRKLQSVNFNETVEEFYGSVFKGTAFTYAYFPNVYNFQDTFADTPLVAADLPLMYWASGAFSNCYSLEWLYAPGLEELGGGAFANCTKLTEFVKEGQYDLTKIKLLEADAFAYSYFKEIYLPLITEINDSAAFQSSQAEYIDIPNVTFLGGSTFNNCQKLKHINMPNFVDATRDPYANIFTDCFALEGLYIPNAIFLPDFYLSSKASGELSLRYIYAPKAVYTVSQYSGGLGLWCHKLQWAFLPSIKYVPSLSDKWNATLYLTEKTEFIDYFLTDYSSTTIVAPEGSYAAEWAQKYGLKYIPSDYRDENIENPVNIEDKGRSIRVTKTGLRFGFSWNEIPEIEDLASDIEYGFIYHYNYDSTPYDSSKLTVENVGTDNIKQKTAVNLDNSTEGTTVFNLVFTDIPASNYDTNISVRAYVCIDGMYFYSNSLNGSFKEVSELVLQDEEIDQNTKNAVEKLLNKEKEQ